jgi:hypothetical protein
MICVLTIYLRNRRRGGNAWRGAEGSGGETGCACGNYPARRRVHRRQIGGRHLPGRGVSRGAGPWVRSEGSEGAWGDALLFSSARVPVLQLTACPTSQTARINFRSQ